MKRSGPLKRGKPMKRMSSKRRMERLIYNRLATEHLAETPYCQCCWLLWPDQVIAAHAARECHHSKGRGKFYLDKTTFRSACVKAHHYIHHVNPNHARAVGLLPPR